MPRVGEPGAQHALVAGDDRRAAVRRPRCWRRRRTRAPASPSAVARGEIALVDPHRDLHDLGRQVHVLVGDPAGQRHRPFDEAGDLVQQAGIVDDGDGFLAPRCAAMPSAMTRLRSAASTSTRWSRSFAAQSAAPETAKAPGAWNRWPSVRLPDDEAVPVIGAVAQIERHDLAIQQADDPAQRAHPGEVAGAAPAHRFGPGQAAQHARHRGRDQAPARRSASACFSRTQ